ncbi:hypothetical protein [Halapricum salinum]|uniref:Uncharacterized protein n=1 Tax=Halapricum salinum TaxID=1457250 RepID=A0A4D6HFB6_9EURY|nr:hypothetical protein [Halapricum salinum]QCC51437.1 hypothetical protein DV733_09365 [Halapricum salinum]
MSQKFSDIALDAQHDTVSFDTLRSKHESYDRPLGSYLKPDEKPEIICDVKKCIIEGVDGTSWKISAGMFDSGHLVVTDERVVAIFPRDEQPQLIDISFTDSTSVSESSNWRSDELRIEDVQGYRYEFVLSTEQDTFDAVTDITHNLSDSIDSEASSAVKFLDQIDAEVAAADDAESALYAIAELFADRSETTRFDQAVAEADSLDELQQQMAAIPGIEKSTTKVSESQSRSLVATPEVDVTGLRQRVTQTARGADPKDVGKYSLGAVLGFGTAAVSAPISTTVGVAALLAGGAATGAYASTNPNSLPAKIDPLSLAMDAKRRGSKLDSTPGAGGHGTGAALGTLEYLSRQDHDSVDEAYAKWLSELDIESVMEGHRVAARYAEQTGELHDPSRASILGGAAGAAYGYTDLDGDIEDVVDDDAVSELQHDTDEEQA